MTLNDEVQIYARIKLDEDEYKDQLLANIHQKENGKFNVTLGNHYPALKDILKECGVKTL